MQGIPLNERKRLGALLDDRPQTEVMAMIPQFSQAETDNFVAPPAQIPEALGVLMFNMERGREPAGNSGISAGLPGYSAL